MACIFTITFLHELMRVAGHFLNCAAQNAIEMVTNVIFLIILIGLTQQSDKLVFVASRPKLSVIANQSADWCGNPPVERNQVTISAKNRKVLPLCGAIVDTFSL